MTAATVTHLQGLLTCLSAFVSFITVFPQHGENLLQNYQSETNDISVIISGNKCMQKVPGTECCRKLRISGPSQTDFAKSPTRLIWKYKSEGIQNRRGC
jgi:hypothetical protein